MTVLTLVRHGETDWNRDGLIQGETDIPLNDVGRAQAQATARTLVEVRDAAAPVVVVSSDLSRAAETADIIAEALGTRVRARYRALRERAYGEAEGMSVVDFRARWGDTHGGEVPGAEPAAALRRRALHAIRRVVADARRASAPYPPQVIAVTHGALLREVLGHATGGELPRPGERIANASAHAFLLERDRLSLRASPVAVQA